MTTNVTERFSRPVSEYELFRGYGAGAPDGRTTDPYERVLLFRISELWQHHRWFQRHIGYILESEQENRAELRHLLRAARLGRRVAAAEREPGARYRETGSW